MCKPSGGKVDVYGPKKHSLKKDGIANTRLDYYDEDTGDLLQQRWYGPDGLAVWDRDWDHDNHKNDHIFPHDHSWNWLLNPPRQHTDNSVNNDYC